MSLFSTQPGAAAPVLFVHGSLSSGRMWIPYLRLFDEMRPCMTPDLLGYGTSPPWTGNGLRLRDEARRLAPARGGPVDIVAHSYGAAVALRLLADAPHSVRSLVLVEPSCFFLLRDLGPRAAAARREIAALRDYIHARVERADMTAAASKFVDYWNGPSVFSAMPAETQRKLELRIGKVVADFDAIKSERMSLAMLRRLPVPTLVVSGDQGPMAPRMIGDAIAKSMPRASSIVIQGAGHMLPTTHSAELTGVLSRWLGVEALTPMARAA
jgi:lipase